MTSLHVQTDTLWTVGTSHTWILFSVAESCRLQHTSHMAWNSHYKRVRLKDLTITFRTARGPRARLSIHQRRRDQRKTAYSASSLPACGYHPAVTCDLGGSTLALLTVAVSQGTERQVMVCLSHADDTQ